MISNTRRNFIRSAAMGAGSLLAGNSFSIAAEDNGRNRENGHQRLSIKRLQQWESLEYGMFIHFGMSTYAGVEMPDGKDSPSLYAPDQLDVDQWIAVAKESGMKYAVLTTKHVAGHCLWPSKHTNYSISAGKYNRDVVAEFVAACRKYRIIPGFYYCSWDNYHKFGSQTPSDLGWTDVMKSFPKEGEKLAPYTTSFYQSFQTAQITELLTQYGPIGEIWIDIPGVLGRGYRTFLYQHIVSLQPDVIIMMNNGIGSGEKFHVDYSWPCDLIAIERALPPESGHNRWREIEGKRYYMPGEACDFIGNSWFYYDGDMPRPETELLKQYMTMRSRNVNFLLNVPPDKHGVIPDKYIKALRTLKSQAGIK